MQVETTRDVFKRVDKPFQMMGETFQLKYIPSEHFGDVFGTVLELLPKTLNIEFLGNEVSTTVNMDKLAEAVPDIKHLLVGKVYEIIRDVLIYQNNKSVEIEHLKKLASMVEVSGFLAMVLEDEEVRDSIGILKSSLGKLQTLFGNPTP